MATIRKRVRADGTTSYQAIIIIKKHGAVVHRESKTFAKKKLADDWAKRREVELQTTAVYKTKPPIQVAALIDQYIARFPPSGRTKRADLVALAKRRIGRMNVHTLTAKELIRHITERNAECKPQTANNDLIWLATVIKTMRGIVDIDTDMTIFASAREVLRREGLIAKADQRDRRPTRSELWALSRYFYGKPMLYIMWLCIYSARRISEITRMNWADIRHDNQTVIIRDLKDPRRKGVKRIAKLPASAYKIILRHGNRSGRVFPFDPKTMSTYFTRACHALGIKDLHLHDLRHEATSRLFERGLSIVEVQQVTLHSQWATLQRYCNLNPGDLDI